MKTKYVALKAQGIDTTFRKQTAGLVYINPDLVVSIWPDLEWTDGGSHLTTSNGGSIIVTEAPRRVRDLLEGSM